MRSRSAILFTALSALTAGLFLLDLAVGAVRIPVADVWAALTGGNCPHTTVKIVVNIRLIKACGSLVGGCGAVGQRIAEQCRRCSATRWQDPTCSASVRVRASAWRSWYLLA